MAHLLAGQGSGPGQRVALLLPRSADAIVAILAVLKTGAAYVPIDPAVPAARMEFVLDDAAPIAVITTAELADRLDGCGWVVIDVDDPPHPGAAQPPHYRSGVPTIIAYIIYTSGTTGAPRRWRSCTATSPAAGAARR